MWFGAGLAVVAFLALLPVVLERLRTTIGPAQRRGAEGGFAQLSQGVTHYRWVGPVRGPVAVLIHGLASPQIAMEGLAEALGNMGYRVLTYDLYGRGLSDAPLGRQSRAFFLQQLSELLAEQQVEEEITFVGYSMGGAIATAFAAENPHRINRVILVASAGVVTNESRFSWFCRVVPLLGDWWHGMFVRRRIMQAIPLDFDNPYIQRVLAAQREELARRGYLPAILSSRRGMLAGSSQKDHRKLAREDVPVIAIWAENDQIIPIKALGVLAQWNRAARQEVVSGADHALPYTHAEQLINALRTALRN
ncbi:alpha/beta fold hydrolase [Cognatiyoonia sp. IB215446]|uniref:alpha/beta fold hydrolase n=1 Tax=Cognatiyoonia sp. IB215446 TaxID=3097355 RepID=UPI002A1309DC|nr:alpha/beta fold hydrolase [Cognatiyoonia sp. IB215446]MDX8346678.1 alpha/beta fold hydrolase [Cognatiyoonia sp. IB215446]